MQTSWLRAGYVFSGILLCLIGVGVVLYQVSESCEDNTLANAYRGYPWCTDILDHINLTFVGVVALFAGIVILALGGPLHWILEPSSEPENEALDRNGDKAGNQRLN
jgi:hypothetical protein